MRQMKRIAGGLGVVAMLMLLAAACGGGSNADATPTQVASEPVEVRVTMSEMTIDSSIDAFTAGIPYHFVVTNNGALPHEFMLIAPMAPGAMSMTEMDKMAIAVIEEDDLPTGTTQTFDITFTQPYAAGTLELACHIAGHYEAGMHMPVTVVSN